jgi:hypothetical protein
MARNKGCGKLKSWNLIFVRVLALISGALFSGTGETGLESISKVSITGDNDKR